MFLAVRGVARAIAEVNPSETTIIIFDAMFAGGFYAIVSLMYRRLCQVIRSCAHHF